MSPFARTIAEEGVYIDNVKLVEGGRFREAEIMALLTAGPWPARNPVQNLNDLKAQVAANQKGADELRAAVAEFGLDVVQAYMGHVQDNAAMSVRRMLKALPPQSAFEYEIDQGSVIRVTVSVDAEAGEAVVDFTGTSPQRPDNFNAPLPVTRAAVLYALRVMVEDDIPMNAGCLRPVRIVAPEGSMLNPRWPAAVVAGNVEVSQAVTDALFGAFGALGSSQGGMNNLTFGDAESQYYETIASGSPAGPGFDGAPAVQVHMTNSRLTDPEVIEARFPVVVEDFHIRAGSGGRGRWNAGDGVSRTLRFLRRMDCAILSSCRRVRPFGSKGGAPGELGRNLVRRLNGREETLKACDQTVLEAGEAVTIITPTGGGWGRRD
jgi:5-oxoprolinase (ATP-hydrolysing)